MRRVGLLLHIVALVAGGPAVCRSATYDVIIASGQVYDGTGRPGYTADVGIQDDRIAAVGSFRATRIEWSTHAAWRWRPVLSTC